MGLISYGYERAQLKLINGPLHLSSNWAAVDRNTTNNTPAKKSTGGPILPPHAKACVPFLLRSSRDRQATWCSPSPSPRRLGLPAPPPPLLVRRRHAYRSRAQARTPPRSVRLRHSALPARFGCWFVCVSDLIWLRDARCREVERDGSAAGEGSSRLRLPHQAASHRRQRLARRTSRPPSFLSSLDLR